MIVPSWGGAGGGHGSGWGATSLPPEQASHPFAAEVHAVLATEPGPDLAIPFSGEGCGVQDLADQLDQVAIADRGGRTGPATGTGCGAAGRRGWSGARRAPGTPRPLVAGRPWLAGPLRRRELQPPLCSAAAPRIAFSMSAARPCARPAATPDHRPTGRAAALQAVLPALQEVVAPGGQPMGLDPSSRDSVSSGSPRSNRSTASIFLPAGHLGRDR
jgi:hypothetical protein